MDDVHARYDPSKVINNCDGGVSHAQDADHAPHHLPPPLARRRCGYW
jgi:hypothetical protein